MSLVRLTTFSDGRHMCTGAGIKINGYILAHHSAIALRTSNSLNVTFTQTYIEEEISIINTYASKQRRQVEFVKAWSCDYSKDFLAKINSQGDEYYKECSTFVLLAMQDVYIPRSNLGVETILLSMKESLMANETLISPQKGDKVASYYGDIAAFYRHAGLICYTFESMDLFLVDLSIPNSSVVMSYPDPGKKTAVLGLTLFQDCSPFVLEMFPMCVTLRHLLSRDCFLSKCNVIPSPSSGDVSISRDPLVDISVRVRCGNNLGSGTLISKDKILTCAHVINHYMDAVITVFFGNQPYPAQVLFYPDNTNDPDFAVLLVAPPPAPVISLCSTPAVLGDQVFAVGTPYISESLYIRPFITTGKVVHRTKDIILGSCPVHDGFSGGGVFNKRGYLIGIVSGKAYPLSNSDPPPRLTEIIPITFIIDIIRHYVASPSFKGSLVNKQRLAELIMSQDNGKL